MDLQLRGRVALVGGASRGLGLAIARRLAAEGADVAICSRDESAIQRAAMQIGAETGSKVVPFVADLSRRDDIERLVQQARAQLGRIDILVSNTGGPPPGLFVDHEDSAWETAFHGLLMSAVWLCRAVLPGMRAQGWGRIIHNTSFTVKEPAERLILSNVFRVGVVALAKTLAREVAADGITVNTVCPGAFETERLEAILDQQAAASGRPIEEIRSEWIARIPIGRLQRPEELADLVAFLASDRAAGITGATVPVDGGMLRGLF